MVFMRGIRAPKERLLRMKHTRYGRILAVLCAASLLLTLGACSPAETLKDWFGVKWVDDKPYEGYKNLDKYVKVGTYKGVEAKTVGQDEYLMYHMENFFAQYRASRGIIIDPAKTAVAKGDFAFFSFEGKAKDIPEDVREEIEAGMKGKVLLTIGSDGFIPGFEDQMVGQALGKEFTVKVTFPDPYQRPELAGKEAVFKCTVFALGTESDKITDEGVDALTGGEFTSVKDFQEKYMLADERFAEELPRMLAEYNMNITFEEVCGSSSIIGLPEKEQQYWDEQITTTAQGQGITPDEFAQQSGYESAAAMRDEQVSHELLIYSIARKEGITVSEEDVAVRLAQKRAEGYSGTDAELYSQLGGKGSVLRVLMREKVSKFVFENAKNAPAKAAG